MTALFNRYARHRLGEGARNLALTKVGDLGIDSKLFIGTLAVSDGYGKVLGRISSDGEKRMAIRL